MALLTVDLKDPADVRYGLAQLTRVAAKYKAKAQAERSERELARMSNEELDAHIDQFLEPQVRELTRTQTGEKLIVPFVQQFPADASIEEIAATMQVEEGTDAVRKAHSLIAGLGRWEGPRGIKIFEPMGGKPQRYRMNPRVRAIVERALAE
jgi:uncharacterized protein YjiS (DUF1127 family)